MCKECKIIRVVNGGEDNEEEEDDDDVDLTLSSLYSISPFPPAKLRRLLGSIGSPEGIFKGDRSSFILNCGIQWSDDYFHTRQLRSRPSFKLGCCRHLGWDVSRCCSSNGNLHSNDPVNDKCPYFWMTSGRATCCAHLDM